MAKRILQAKIFQNRKEIEQNYKQAPWRNKNHNQSAGIYTCNLKIATVTCIYLTGLLISVMINVKESKTSGIRLEN